MDVLRNVVRPHMLSQELNLRTESRPHQESCLILSIELSAKEQTVCNEFIGCWESVGKLLAIAYRTSRGGGLDMVVPLPCLCAWFEC